MFGKWESYRRSLKTNPSKSTWKNYHIAFNNFSAVHHMKIISIRAQDLQNCITAQSTKSKATVGSMRAIVKGMWDYALANEYTDKDITSHLVYEFTETGTPIHTRFTDDEISALWQALGIVNNVDIILIYIYTGCRPSELLEITRENVHLEDRYMIGGIKTDAGKDRIIPIHEAIYPLVKARYEQNRPYLISNKFGNHYTRAVYHNTNWNTCMERMNLKHSPHDTRYTFASLAEQSGMNETCRKIIMGHALPNKDGTMWKTGDTSNVTEGTYTEKTIAQLVDEVNKIAVNK